MDSNLDVLLMDSEMFTALDKSSSFSLDSESLIREIAKSRLISYL